MPTQFTDSSTCEVTILVLTVGGLHVTKVTGEMFNSRKTGRFLFLLIPKDILPESLPCNVGNETKSLHQTLSENVDNLDKKMVCWSYAVSWSH